MRGSCAPFPAGRVGNDTLPTSAALYAALAQARVSIGGVRRRLARGFTAPGSAFAGFSALFA